MSISINGLDDLQKKLDRLKKKAENLDGEHQVPLSELLPPSFMSKHTNFDSIDEMFQESDFTIETIEDFEKIPDEEWDNFISIETQFDNWSSMLEKATSVWASKQLGF